MSDNRQSLSDLAKLTQAEPEAEAPAADAPAVLREAAAARFVQLVLTVDVPTGWVALPGHLRFDATAD